MNALSVLRTVSRAFWIVAVSFALPSWSRGEEPVNYNRQIKPLLTAHCYACHGPDAKERKAELRLDVRASAVKDAIVPGQPERSELVERLTSTDPDKHMPPADSKKPSLTPDETALMKRWIAEGARYETHWAYVVPKRPAVPEAAEKGWARNPIDQFIAAKRIEQKLPASPEADKRTLIRRLYFDLLGLPPKPQDVDAFVKDASPDAYEKLVDRALASPHFGERMAAYWLDLVRYADSGGYHSDNDRDVWMYRDYVIQAFNENKPFDQFTREQLAGDLVPGANNTTRVASGYNRLLMTTEEGGAQAKEYISKYQADRVRNASAVWLGSTLGCAQCHDHKFDPFTAHDFYSFGAFFADIQELAVGRQPQTKIPTAEQEGKIKELDGQIASVQGELNQPRPELASAEQLWEDQLHKGQGEWAVAKPTTASSQGGATLTVEPDGTVLAAGAKPDKDSYTLTFSTPLQGVTALRLEVLPHDSLPAHGPGRAANGNFVLNELKATLGGKPVTFSNVSATHAQKDWAVAGLTDGQPASGWAILPQVGKANHAVLECTTDLAVSADQPLVLTFEHNYGTSHALGAFRISTTNAVRPVRAAGVDPLPKPIQDILAIERAKRTPDQQKTIDAHYRTIAPGLQPLREKLAGLQKQREGILAAAPSTLVSQAGEPRVVRIQARGNWLDETGEIVQPAVPGFMASVDVGKRRATRLDLANWLVAKENPLTARVLVNRLWKLCYGYGLVRTLDDFGTPGSPPTHPALLDWLAVECEEHHWDVKHMVRLMVTTSTYRQSSVPTAEMRQRDPLNLYLAHQATFRLEAEFVRDNALAVSGLLSPKLGGPSVRPYQPAGYWAWLNFPTREWTADKGENEYRRGLYTWWQRSFLHPSLAAFDAPTREECTVERPRSNTPLQALVLLNDPTYVEAARVLAARVLQEGGSTPSDRITFAMRQAVDRQPTETEMSTLLGLLEAHRQKYAADRNAATALLSVGDAKPPAGLDPVELAAWTSIARVILNLHETVTRS